MSEERAKYGYCPKCGEPFDRPYTHCPFCNEVNPHLDQDLAKKKDAVSEQLERQMKANREWADQNRAEVKMQVDAQIEQNLREMKQQVKSTTDSVTKGKGSSKKWLKRGIIFLILFLFVLPINSGMIKDGGTTYWGPFIPIYQFRDVHGMTGCVDKDGNDVYLVGTEVYIFFIPVYENTHYEARGTGRRVEEDEMVPMIREHNKPVSEVLAEIP